jgi:hypothetical protein
LFFANNFLTLSPLEALTGDLLFSMLRRIISASDKRLILISFSHFTKEAKERKRW